MFECLLMLGPALAVYRLPVPLQNDGKQNIDSAQGKQETMKMLMSDSSVAHLESLKNRLEESGIPACIQRRESARMIIPATLVAPTLWVYLDEQFEDASKLIHDPAHIVMTGVDVAFFYESQPNDSEMSESLNATLIYMAFAVLAVIVVMLLIAKFVSMPGS